ncbi:MAG: helix-hairpin-helix domain-containing protein [Planctomycetes bacterium]|nr:helix-hairpin-helix domain-containing protein [Planctomycetota bacterium]
MTTSCRENDAASENEAAKIPGPDAVTGMSIDSQAMTLSALALVIMAAQAVHLGVNRGGRTTTETVCSTIDPNQAPWYEFTALPRIGESLARRITAYRTEAARRPDDGAQSPVFHSAADLDDVRGIGPKTVLRIAPHLRFD